MKAIFVDKLGGLRMGEADKHSYKLHFPVYRPISPLTAETDITANANLNYEVRTFEKVAVSRDYLFFQEV